MKKFIPVLATAFIISACTASQKPSVQNNVSPVSKPPVLQEVVPMETLVQTTVVATPVKKATPRYFISTMNLCKLPEKFDRTLYISSEPQKILPASIVEVAKNQLIHDGFTVVDTKKEAFWTLSFKEEKTRTKLFSRDYEESVSAYLLTLSYQKNGKTVNGTELYIVTNTSDPLRLVPDLEELSSKLFDCNKQQMFACKLSERTNTQNCLIK